MVHGWGSFRTTEGDVFVGDEVLRIHRSLRKFLQGQRSRWRQGSHTERLGATARVVLFLILPLSTAAQLYRITEAPTLLAVLTVLGLVASLVTFWTKRIRGTTVPLSAIEDVTLDTDDH